MPRMPAVPIACKCPSGAASSLTTCNNLIPVRPARHGMMWPAAPLPGPKPGAAAMAGRLDLLTRDGVKHDENGTDRRNCNRRGWPDQGQGRAGPECDAERD